MAIGTELIALGVRKIVEKGEAEGRIVACKTASGSDNMFLGAAVTRFGETADTIDGATSVQLYHVNETMTFVSDGSNWYII